MEISTVTDAAGNYTLSEVNSGIHELIFTNPNSGTIKLQQTSFTGNGTLIQNNSVTERATFSITSAVLKDTLYYGIPAFKVSIVLASDTKARNALLVFGKTQTIDPASGNSFESSYQFEIPANTTNHETFLPYEYFDLEGRFASGSTVHAKFFPCARNFGSYYDYFSDKRINTSCGTALATNFSFVMP